jgi:hypothetical protein
MLLNVLRSVVVCGAVITRRSQDSEPGVVLGHSSNLAMTLASPKIVVHSFTDHFEMNENSTIVVRLRINRRLVGLKGEVLLQSRGMRWEDSTQYLLLSTCFGQPRSRCPPCKPHATKHSAANNGHLFPHSLVNGIDRMSECNASECSCRVSLLRAYC